MATSAEKLAASLEKLKQLQDSNGMVVLRGHGQLGKVHFTRLLNEGWLKEVIKGWYIASRPGMEGDTTDWYTSYWAFLAEYCSKRFSNDWCLSAEQSLNLHSGDATVPQQAIVRNPKGNNSVTQLLYGTSLFNLKAKLPTTTFIHPEYKVRMFSLPEALVYASPTFYRQCPVSARACLQMVKDESEILGILADKGAVVRAGRLAGAFRNIGRNNLADNILSYMKRLGHDIREDDPFEYKMPGISLASVSPQVARISLIWSELRQQVIDNFPAPGAVATDIKQLLRQIDDKYVQDAYHSLSIEGYKVSDELIEKVKSGSWNPKGDDKDAHKALVARGYYQSFKSVKNTIGNICKGANAGQSVDDDHAKWYFEMWQPMVAAGIYRPSDIIGYRNRPVYIRGSRHVPMSCEALRDAMPEYFRLLREEQHPAVRAILGHFLFGFIHPYNDGNGRMSRFLMNTMLASGGYQWTVIPVEKRSTYMESLEMASIDGNIIPFTKLIADLIV